MTGGREAGRGREEGRGAAGGLVAIGGMLLVVTGGGDEVGGSVGVVESSLNSGSCEMVTGLLVAGNETIF